MIAKGKEPTPNINTTEYKENKDIKKMRGARE